MPGTIRIRRCGWRWPKNKATPLQASTILAVDRSLNVRAALAKRILKLLPGLDPDQQSQLYAFAVEALAVLALDEVIKIRTALSSALKDSARTPPKVAAQLARDVEREVAEPILRFCTALSDEDLLKILADHPREWATEAIADRRAVSEKVGRGIIATGQRVAGLILLRNRNAEISPVLMDDIIERARTYTEWQLPVAVHASLPAHAAKRLAEFADLTVRDVLQRRDDFDPETQEEVMNLFRRRLVQQAAAGGDGDVTRRVAALKAQGLLGEDTVSDAIGLKDRVFVVAALASLAGVSVAQVEKLMALRAAKPIVALSHRAGLSMRIALRLQQEIGQVPHQELLYPRGGTDYPLEAEEIKAQLAVLGIS